MTKKWRNPHTGGESRMSDVVQIALTRDQLAAYHRALSCAIDHAEEARGNQSKLSFVATLVELSDKAQLAIYQVDATPQTEWDPGVRARRCR